MRLALLRSWPLAARVPLVVAGLMVAVSLVIGQVVLHRLARDQERHVADLAAAYLDGVSTAVLPAAIRRDVWEAYDALDRARARYEGLAIVFAVVTEPAGHVLAASDPRLFPVGSLLPEALLERYGPDGRLTIDEAVELAFLARELREGAVPVGRILVELDIGALIAERRAVRWTLVGVNAGLTLLLAGLGVMLVRRMLGPVAILRAHVAAGAEGPIRPVDEAVIARQPAEFAALFRAFNRTAQAVAEREAMAARLAAEEKYALLGKLASAMAHEVNNPLGGMFTAVDTLARHGDDPAVRARSIGFLRRGLTDIRDVVRAGLVTSKGRIGEGPLTRADLDDLRHLVRHEIERRGLSLVWRNDLARGLALDRTMVRQIALNLLLNACAASPPGGCVRLEARVAAGAFALTVRDDGPGLPAAARALLAAPDAPPPGGGLGLWTAARLAAALGGRITSADGAPGTSITLRVPLADGALADVA
ncbi:ATP-binding protein [Elioraea sp.]|uniref:ATP-binding protein n=1 Tax=Elioraea sp. TaxID=2185103 RepID=UPI003F714344